MGVKKIIEIKDGTNGKKKYYYWSEYESYEEALHYAKRIKNERKNEMRIRYYIVETSEGRFLPTPKFILYLNKDLRII